jgi:hypothetical protein
MLSPVDILLVLTAALTPYWAPTVCLYIHGQPAGDFGNGLTCPGMLKML